jgi:hypothetical protein
MRYVKLIFAYKGTSYLDFNDICKSHVNSVIQKHIDQAWPKLKREKQD